MAAALPSLSISRRVNLCIGAKLFDAIDVTKVGTAARLAKALKPKTIVLQPMNAFEKSNATVRERENG